MSDQTQPELPRMNSDRDLTRIGVLYAAERADMIAIMGHALTLVSFVVGYIGVGGAILANYDGEVPDWVYLVLPVPPLFAACYLTQINALSFLRTVTARTLEDELIEAEVVGVRAGDTIMDLRKLGGARLSLAIMTLVGYLGGYLVVFGSAAGCTYQLWEADSNLFVWSLIIHSVILLAVLWAWCVILFMINEKNVKTWAESQSKN